MCVYSDLGVTECIGLCESDVMVLTITNLLVQVWWIDWCCGSGMMELMILLVKYGRVKDPGQVLASLVSVSWSGVSRGGGVGRVPGAKSYPGRPRGVVLEGLLTQTGTSDRWLIFIHHKFVEALICGFPSSGPCERLDEIRV